MRDIMDRLRSGEAVDMMSAEYGKAIEELKRSNELSFQLNQLSPLNVGKRKALLAELLQAPLQGHSDIFTPVQIDFGCNFKLGHDVFINHSLTVMAIGGIEIGNNVQIGPQVTIVIDNHDSDNRNILCCKRVRIEDNVWIGAGAIITPGAHIQSGAIIGAGAVVTGLIPANAVAVGVPAKIIKYRE